MSRKILSLDGNWLFWTDPFDSYTQDRLPAPQREIPVPLPWQALEDLHFYNGVGWYRRTLLLTGEWLTGGSVFLHIGAASENAQVWWNGVLVGEHEGGYLPFALDVTGFTRSGENTITIRITNALEVFDERPHGKQSWYGVISGLWQAVQLIHLPARHLLQPAIQTRENRLVSVRVSTSHPLAPRETLRAEIFDPHGMVCAAVETSGALLDLEVADALLWDIGQPHLYMLRLAWLDQHGSTIDAVEDRFGFRTVETSNGQILLNGRPVYLRGALDQDYYPETIATPPSMEYLRSQFQQALEMGLNLLRIHIKVGDPRYYQAADEVGLLLWTELPNFHRLTKESKTRARATLSGMLERDGNHPSIIAWTIINESWGVDLTIPEHRSWLAETYHWFKEQDPSRLVVDNSACAGNGHVVSDIADIHVYYAMPDHAAQFAEWTETYAARPDWLYCPEYPGAEAWNAYLRDPWKTGRGFLPAQENEPRGDAPLIVSEFGNWGLPDMERWKTDHGDREPWWFETGAEFGDGVVSPHGVARRFDAFHLKRSFTNLSELSRAHQRLQFEALKRQIEYLRRHNSIQGYVITEFTDVHWECNGLLDLYRNPKAGFDAFGWLNADDLIVTEMERSAYRSGDEAWVRLYFSHYSQHDLRDCILQWSLEGFPHINGYQRGMQFAPYQVSSMGGLRLEIPPVAQPVRALLRLQMQQPSGQVIAHGAAALTIFPAALPRLEGLRVHMPENDPVLAEGLRMLGCQLTALDNAAVVVTTVLTDAVRARLLAGSRVVWLAEAAGSLQTFLPGLQIADRTGTPWQGDWASTIHWIHRQPHFADLPGDGLVGFVYEDLTPETVLTGFPYRVYAKQVLAGMAVGWLHRPAATILHERYGHGHLTASTFRLREHVQENPVAAYLLSQLVGLTASAQ